MRSARQGGILGRGRLDDELTWFENVPHRRRSSSPTRTICSSSLAPFVPVMESTDSRHCNDSRRG